MSYRKTLERLRAYAPQRLIVDQLESEGQCCAVGAAAGLGVVAAVKCSKVWDYASLSKALDLTETELDRVFEANDTFRGTPEQRYAHVLEWLEARVAREACYAEDVL